uniref:Olfactory receptor n=1 Tax=Neovison vison TaxID=452646 RepID=A0A8C7EYC5_NEOVI
MGYQFNNNVTVFIFMGLSQNENIEILCFVLFLFCYIAIWVGNLLIIISITDLFYQPMYYFLSHLSLMDICYTSCVRPKLIGDLLLARKTISYDNCMLQVFALHFLGMIEILILTIMAFDRYAAICKPLHYLLIMNRTRCHLLVLAAWAGGALHSFPQFLMAIQLPFCGPNEIDHYFCDIFPLLKVACTDTYITGILVVANSGMVTLVTFVLLFGSYVVILFSLGNRSAEGRRKALSTCGSHITVVILCFGPLIFVYLRPPTSFPEDKIFALFYTIIMKKAMRRVWCQRIFSEEKHN